MEKKKVMSLNKFGKCNRCGTLMVLCKSQYSIYKVSDTAWIQAQLRDEIKYELVCPKCGSKRDMHLTIRGLEPDGFQGIATQKPILGIDRETIGYVERENKNESTND